MIWRKNNLETLLEYVRAFLVGGLICMIAQILIDKTKLTPARILVSYVVTGVILGALGVYKPLVEFAGGGATVPLTGFGYLISKGVKEAVDKDGLIGVLTGGMTATAGGLSAAIIFGLLAALIFKTKARNK
ncbi:MAG: stage V sporulation protein AE [Ruminococcaceae bacterium]|nr:stage V sporulation protein AE [Oscillospiraceae bacterium]